jgi:putative ABC transport system ATP-binding protein
VSGPRPPAPANTSCAPIRIEHLTKQYVMGAMRVHALRGVSLQVERGEFVAIMGASGSGKSTLMNLLGCLDRPTSGKYWLEDVETSTFSRNDLAWVRNRRIGFVFQGFNLLSRTTALENVELPLVYAHLPWHERRRLALDALDRVGLAGRHHHTPAQLSGGQQQRVAIARALIHQPRLLVCDEPTAALDAHSGQTVMQLLRRVALDPQRAVIVVTHDNRIFQYGNRILRMSDGCVVDDVEQEVLNSVPQEQVA